MANTSFHLHQAARLLIIIPAITFTTHGCSVKEMRDACPCRVVLDLSVLLECRGGCRRGTVETDFFDASGTRLSSHMFGADTCRTLYEFKVPRGQYRISAAYFSDIEVWSPDEGRMELLAGAEADSLYGESALIDAWGEETVFRPEADKQFTTVNIYFSSPVTGLAVEVSAPSNSIDMSGLAACGDRSRHYAIVDGQRHSCRICRQCSDDIIVSFFNPFAGKMIAQLNVAEMSRSRGYDFNARILSDIDITIDFEQGNITLETEGWKESFLNVIF